MDEEDETDILLGLPPTVVRPLQGRIWVCSVCLEIVASREPIPMLASCENYGWSSFESEDAK
jgi:hypothetical protein